jgi:hypothetical protein
MFIPSPWKRRRRVFEDTETIHLGVFFRGPAESSSKVVDGRPSINEIQGKLGWFVFQA